MNNKELRQLWREFNELTLEQDLDGNEIISDNFHTFDAGTDKYEILHWFDDNSESGVISLSSDIILEDMLLDFIKMATWTQNDSLGAPHTILKSDMIEYIIDRKESDADVSSLLKSGINKGSIVGFIEILDRLSTEMLDRKSQPASIGINFNSW